MSMFREHYESVVIGLFGCGMPCRTFSVFASLSQLGVLLGCLATGLVPCVVSIWFNVVPVRIRVILSIRCDDGNPNSQGNNMRARVHDRNPRNRDGHGRDRHGYAVRGLCNVFCKTEFLVLYLNIVFYLTFMLTKNDTKTGILNTQKYVALE